jgi:phage/plasmid-like protein (TIGR03299 family)
MAHELDTNTLGEARFAYNTFNGDPWHKLGVAVDGYGTIEQMLMASGADYTVEPAPIYVTGRDGQPVIVADKFATVRHTDDFGPDGFTTRTDVLGVVGNGYTIEQNREAAQFALDCVGASGDTAVIDTMGVLFGGSQFFTYLRLEPMILDPNGVADEITQGLCVRTSHDSSISLCAYPTAVRVVCNNTATWSMNAATRKKQVVRVRHTRNKDNYKADAVITLGLAAQLRELFVTQAEQMIHMTASFDTVRKVAKQLWPIEQDPSKRAQTIHDNRIDDLYQLWGSATNSAGFGKTAWSAWNTITEYLDHGRGSDSSKRALASMNLDSQASDLKDKAAQLLLAGV